MKRSLTTIVCLFSLILASFNALSQEFLGFEVEQLETTAYGTTYRVYAEFDDPDCWVKNVLADGEGNPLIIQPLEGASIYHSALLNVDLAQNMNELFFPLVPDGEFDSWLTIGTENAAGYGGVTTVDMVDALAGFNAGVGFNSTVATWLVQIGGTPAEDWTAGEELRVLLAQITLTNNSSNAQGHFQFQLNITWQHGSVSTIEYGALINSEMILYGGCMSPEACNYNPVAMVDDGSCVFADVACSYCDGSVVVTMDADGDGICDGDEVEGCMDISACDYSPYATDPGSCYYGACIYGCTDLSAVNWNSSADIDDGSCVYLGCTDPEADNYDPSANENDGSCIYIGCYDEQADNYWSGANIGDQEELCEYWGCIDSVADNYDAGANVGDDTCLYTGCYDVEAENYSEVANTGDQTALCVYSGCMDQTACNFDPQATIEDWTCEYFSCTSIGCTDAAACNFLPTALFENGSCTYADDGYDCSGGCLSDVDADGVCDGDEVGGCVDDLACNFSPEATEDDGSCTYPVTTECGCLLNCDGTFANDADGDGVCDETDSFTCTDDVACNFNTCATDSYGCIYPSPGYDCTGACLADTDGDGVCDANEVPGCTDPEACCNYDSLATDDDGSCLYPGSCVCSCESDTDGDGVCDEDEVVGCMNSLAVDYNEEATDEGVCSFSPPSSWATSPNPSAAVILGTITVDGGPADAYDVVAVFTEEGVCAGTAEVIAVDGATYMVLTAYGDDATTASEVEGFAAGEAMELRLWRAVSAESLIYVNAFGAEVLGSWANMNGAPLPAFSNPAHTYDFLTSTSVAQCNDESACNYSEGSTSAANCIYPPLGQNCAGECLSDQDLDGVCDPDELPGCTSASACNYDPLATDDDGSCTTLDACGVCGGPGAVYACGCTDIPPTDCDCQGSTLDAIDVCGGNCTADEDGDGVCDDVDACIGVLDACGVCNGPGAIYSCGCSEQPVGDCDCDGNVLDAVGMCGGGCAADLDADGICDDVDPCVGALDACGVCNGPGAVYACGCSDVPAGDCDCDGNVTDTLGVCGGGCVADADEDGVCDDVDPCVGVQDECGVCNGEGAVYACGCSDLPEGDCDCDGNTLDAIGICGGDCPADADGDGVCDDAEVLGCDDPNACNFMCDATENDGSCTFAEAYFDCNGECLVDTDGDGICEQDEVPGCMDPAACNFDAAATDAMNGYCAYAAPGRDCDGSCLADADGDGVCNGDELPGCTDANAVNYNEYATELDVAQCIYGNSDCPADITGDNYVGTNDLLIILSFYGSDCPPN